MSDQKKNYRYQAFCVIEAQSPIQIGSGEKALTVSNSLLKDAFGFYYIPATSLTGVLRHLFWEKDEGLEESEGLKSIFGHQEMQKDKGQGSRLILSSAHLLLNGKKIADGLSAVDLIEVDEQLEGKGSGFEHIQPVRREHVRINHRGVADKDLKGKFESELLPKGCRFAFEIELVGTAEDAENWEAILSLLHHPLFRLGGGSRKGFGRFKVEQLITRSLDLSQEDDLQMYLAKSSQLAYREAGQNKYAAFKPSSKSEQAFKHYRLSLSAEDFMLFGGDFNVELAEKALEKARAEKAKKKQDEKKSDEKSLSLTSALADFTPKTEKIIYWNGGTMATTDCYLMPASSIKGAIAHRFVYHLNKLLGIYVDQQEVDHAEVESKLADYEQQLAALENYQAKPLEEINDRLKNLAELEKKLAKLTEGLQNMGNAETVELQKTALFGQALDSKAAKGQRGRILFEDIYLAKDTSAKKIFNHVAIDRFTAGALDQALYSEEVLQPRESMTLNIYVEQKAFEAVEENQVQQALEASLKDLCEGRLPLGGGVMRGHGRVKGKIQPTEA